MVGRRGGAFWVKRVGSGDNKVRKEEGGENGMIGVRRDTPNRHFWCATAIIYLGGKTAAQEKKNVFPRK